MLRTIETRHPKLVNEITVVSLKKPRLGKPQVELSELYNRICLNARSFYGVVTFIRFIKVCRQTNATTLYAILSPTMFLSGLLTFVTSSRVFWGFRTSSLGSSRGPLTTSVMRIFTRLMFPRVTGVICNSEEGVQYMSRLTKRHDKIHLIRNGIDSNKFYRAQEVRDRGRALLGVAPEQALIVSVGRLVPDKDHKTLLTAMKRIIDDAPNAVLTLVGHGPTFARNELLAIVRELGLTGHFQHLETIEDMNALYNAADLVLQSSRIEGLSNVLLEALSVGVRVVSTNCGDSSHLLPADCLANPGDAKSLAELALRQLRKTRVRDGSQRLFSSELMADETLRRLGLVI